MFLDIKKFIIEYRPQNPLELIKLQREMEEKVVSIWSVLSAFEGKKKKKLVWRLS